MKTKCTYDPKLLLGLPMGMFHCPECGQMILAGLDHPDYEEEEMSEPVILSEHSRLVDIGSHRFTQVVALDEPAPDNKANHLYRVESVPQTSDHPVAIFGLISFQDGPVKEKGVNGLHNEDLLAIVIDRLRGFQSGDFACRENLLALTKLEETMHWLNHRTAGRQKRGVEGTNVA